MHEGSGPLRAAVSRAPWDHRTCADDAGICPGHRRGRRDQAVVRPFLPLQFHIPHGFPDRPANDSVPHAGGTSRRPCPAERPQARVERSIEAISQPPSASASAACSCGRPHLALPHWRDGCWPACAGDHDGECGDGRCAGRRLGRPGHRGADTIDRLVVLALILFLVACVFSQFPRASLGAATTALAFARDLRTWCAAHSLGRACERLLLTSLTLLGLAFGVAFAIWWGATWATWVAASTPLPPLDLGLPVGPFRQYQSVGIAAALLMPAPIALMGRRELPARVLWRRGRNCSRAGGAHERFTDRWFGLGAGLLVGLAPGPATPVASGAYRGGWLGLVAVAVCAHVWDHWLRAWGIPTPSRFDPRSGARRSAGGWRLPWSAPGPGASGRTFTFSGYFNRYLDVGRHPDDAVVQMLAGGGLVGLAALVVLAAALVVGLRHEASVLGRFGRGSHLSDLLPDKQPFGLPLLDHRLRGVGRAAAALQGSCGPRVRLASSVPGRRGRRSRSYRGRQDIHHRCGIPVPVFARRFRGCDPATTARSLAATLSLDPRNALYHRELGPLAYTPRDRPYGTPRS